MTGALLNISCDCSVERLRPGRWDCGDVEQQGLTQRVLGSLLPDVRQPEHEPDHSLFFVMKLYMFRTVGLSIISSLFTVHSAMVYVIQFCRQFSSRTRMELQSHSGPARKLYDIYQC